MLGCHLVPTRTSDSIACQASFAAFAPPMPSRSASYSNAPPGLMWPSGTLSSSSAIERFTGATPRPRTPTFRKVLVSVGTSTRGVRRRAPPIDPGRAMANTVATTQSFYGWKCEAAKRRARQIGDAGHVLELLWLLLTAILAWARPRRDLVLESAAAPPGRGPDRPGARTGSPPLFGLSEAPAHPATRLLPPRTARHWVPPDAPETYQLAGDRPGTTLRILRPRG
jgi:hypothetical protein